MNSAYESLLSKPSSKQWKRIGLTRRAGVGCALFSLYSARSVGIGEVPDLKLLVDWCKRCGLSIVQLLPLNDVGFHFSPYDADSAMALDAMYLSLEDVAGVETDSFVSEIGLLRSRFPGGKKQVDYLIKGAKLELLWKMFLKRSRKQERAFEHFCMRNKRWLHDYALFRVLKENHQQKSWLEWKPELKERNPAAIREFEKDNRLAVQFQQWLQWQLYLQLTRVKEYANDQGVLLMGDLPFLVSKDSADVWSHQNYFNLDLAVGAPPDRYFAKGQRWGMPPYRWQNMKRDGHAYFKAKLNYAAHFYDLFRLDHAVGFFCVWTIALTEPAENHGLNGAYEPNDRTKWEPHGKRLLQLILKASPMLACAEDLGTIPECVPRVLKKLGIPGTDIQKWMKDQKRNHAFTVPEAYRSNSCVALSNHDMPSFLSWWEQEAGTVDAELFQRACEAAGVSFAKASQKLFEANPSKLGRLRWRGQVRNISTLIQHLNLSRMKARQLIELYSKSYNERERYWKFLGFGGSVGAKRDAKIVRRAIEKANLAQSIFSIQSIQDWLSLDESLSSSAGRLRINFPGTSGTQNWSVVLPVSLEKILKLNINTDILHLNKCAQRN